MATCISSITISARNTANQNVFGKHSRRLEKRVETDWNSAEKKPLLPHFDTEKKRTDTVKAARKVRPIFKIISKMTLPLRRAIGTHLANEN